MVLGFGADCNVDDAAGSRAEVWVCGFHHQNFWAPEWHRMLAQNVREKVLARKVDFFYVE